MPTRTYEQQWSISDEPEPGFMVSTREWYGYVNRIKTLIDPIENPYGWAEVCGGFALAMVYSAATLPHREQHAALFGANLGLAVAATVLTLFFVWLGKRMGQRHRDNASAIVSDMQQHCKAKAPHADHPAAGEH